MSNVIFAPSNATYHTDSGTHTVSAYASNYSNSTVNALSQFGYSAPSSGGSASSTSSGSSGSIASVLGSGSTLDHALSDLATTSSSDFGDILREAMQIAAGNSALSQSFAREQMDFQRESDQYAMNWSAQEAQKTRDWQTQLSNTAHQREVSDLVAAGLNPVLSANGGAVTPSGATGSAYSSSGAMGSVDNSATQLFGTALNAAVQLKSLDVNAELAREQMATSERINAYSADASITGHQITSAATLGAASAAAAASKYGADISSANVDRQIENALKVAGIQAESSKYSADASSGASRYNTDVSNYTKQTETTGLLGSAYRLGINLGRDLAGSKSSDNSYWSLKKRFN